MRRRGRKSEQHPKQPLHMLSARWHPQPIFAADTGGWMINCADMTPRRGRPVHSTSLSSSCARKRSAHAASLEQKQLGAVVQGYLSTEAVRLPWYYATVCVSQRLLCQWRDIGMDNSKVQSQRPGCAPGFGAAPPSDAACVPAALLRQLPPCHAQSRERCR